MFHLIYPEWGTKTEKKQKQKKKKGVKNYEGMWIIMSTLSPPKQVIRQKNTQPAKRQKRKKIKNNLRFNVPAHSQQ